jgi:hypothetical protein
MTALKNTFGSDADAKAASLEAASRHLHHVFNLTDIIEIRCLKHGGKGSKQFWITRDRLHEIHDELCLLNDKAYSVYYGINPRSHDGGATADDVSVANALAVDCDHGCTPDQLIERATAGKLAVPSMVLMTGGGAQGLWRLIRSISPAHWERRQAGIIGAIEGADATIKDAPRILRLAGFINRKPKYPDAPMVMIHRLEELAVHDPFDFPEGQTFAASSREEGEPCPIDGTGYLPPQAKAFLDNGTLYPPKDGLGEPGRRDSAFRCACDLAAAGIDQAEAAEMIVAICATLGLSDDEIDDVRSRQVANAYSQPREPNIAPEDRPRVKLMVPDAVPEITLTAVGDDKVKVVAKRGATTFVGKCDPVSDKSRDRTLAAVIERLGEGTDTSNLESELVAIGSGEKTLPKTSATSAATLVDMPEVDAGRIIRPMRFIVGVDGEWKSGTTIPFVFATPEGLTAVWRTYICGSEGHREAIDVPPAVTVSGTTFFISPDPAPPTTKTAVSWSKESRESWIATGEDSIPPAQLFDELVSVFDEFVDIPADVAEPSLRVFVLYVFLTHCTPVFRSIPYIALHGPTGSGKSRVLDCLKHVALGPTLVSSTTAAAVYRTIDLVGGTILHDESETLSTAESGSVGELYPVYLSGYKHDGVSHRCDGENNQPKEFSTFGPKVFASVKEPPETLAGRCITFMMLRAQKDSPKPLNGPDKANHAARWQRLRDALFVWGLNHGNQLLELVDAEEVTPRMFPRSQEIWGPILQLAQLFERDGVTGLLAQMQAFALAKSADAEAILVPDTDAAILRALVELNGSSAKRPPTAGEILTRAQAHGLDAGQLVNPKMVGSILRRYAFKSRRSSGRVVFDAPVDGVRQVESRYGLQLLPEEEKTDAPLPETRALSALSALEAVSDEAARAHRAHRVRVPDTPTPEKTPIEPASGTTKPGKVVL